MAQAPSRATGSMTIAFGLIAVPVQVFAGVEETGIKRSRFSPAGNPIKLRNVDAETGEEIAYADLVSKIQTDAGWVELSDDEITHASNGSAGSEVVAFLPATLLGTYHVEGISQVRPAHGPDKRPCAAYEKAFALLMDAMASTKTFALIRYCSRGKSHAAALTSDGFLHQLTWDGAVREARPMPEVEFTADERKLAAQIVKHQRTDERVMLVDEAAEKVRAYAESKAAGETTEEAPLTPPTDLVAILQASLQAGTAKTRKPRVKKAS